jgi:galactose oxidase
MPEGFETVPDWFSWENQDAGIAVANFGGQQHLVVMMVNDGAQQNRGLYRIGHNLDAAGTVTGTWTGWLDVPDWFSWDNQGADIAVADLAGTGAVDLVVFMIDNQPQQNRGVYRIGKGLDVNGVVTGGWTPWIDLPEWFSWDNQGAGIAVTAPDPTGQQDLIVFMIDNGPGQNRGVFRVGKGLDANGAVTGGWTPWADVPDWFPFENQGAGVAVTDLEGDSSRDLIVFMIDNPAQAGVNGGQNQGFFKIGRNLGADGAVANWDASWSPLPYWFSWENQGGGIAIATLGGKRKLLSLMADNPPGQNVGLYQVLDFDFDPASVGQWGSVFALNNVAIHMSVLPNGKVLYWGRRDNASGTLDPHSCTPWVLDPDTKGQVKTANAPAQSDGTSVNLFCSGHAFLPDGHLLVAGGHLNDGNGSDQASIYDWRSNSWTALPKMNNGRWYPTATSLADGRILVISGSFQQPIPGGIQQLTNAVPQIWDGTAFQPTVNFIGLPLYPRMHVASDGQVFMAGSNAQTYLLNIGTNSWAPLPAPGGRRRNGERQYAPAVMYDVDKVIYIGGGNDPGTNAPTAEAETIDLGAAVPAWQGTDRMHFARRQHNATLLPDGTVLVTGGTMGVDFNDLRPGRPVHAAELWNPGTGAWRLLAAEATDRCYHGTAVLLPDATVLSAGSGEFNISGPGVPAQPNDPKDSHRDAQIFKPPYLFAGPQPQITNAPAAVDYGETFTIQVSGPNIARISWIRLPSVTHAFDENQRINFLGFALSAGGDLAVTAPDRPELCPPGHYMLFVLSAAGVPSKARIMQIGNAVPTPHAAAVAAAEGAGMRAAVDTQSLAERDAFVLRSTGVPATVGLTARCPYGLAACWGGAYEALKKLQGVQLVRPIANAEHSTADVYLGDRGLPDLRQWPAQFAQWANRSYDFRGVEVTLSGTVREQDGNVVLISRASDDPVHLAPLQPGMKIQWDHQVRMPQAATAQEMRAYDDLLLAVRQPGGAGEAAEVTGPLIRSDSGWDMYVRLFRSLAMA